MTFDKDFDAINTAIRGDNRRAFRHAFKQLCNTAPNGFKFTLAQTLTCTISPFTHIGRATKYYTISNGRIYRQSFKNSECYTHGYDIEDFIFRVWNCYITGNSFYCGHIDANGIGETYFKNKYIID